MYVELATQALFLRRGMTIQNIVYRDAGNGNASDITLVSRVIAHVTDSLGRVERHRSTG